MLSIMTAGAQIELLIHPAPDGSVFVVAEVIVFSNGYDGK